MHTLLAVERLSTVQKGQPQNFLEKTEFGQYIRHIGASFRVTMFSNNVPLYRQSWFIPVSILVFIMFWLQMQPHGSPNEG